MLPIILIVVILVVGVLYCDSNLRLVTTEYELIYQNLPDSFDGFRIVVLSDVHATQYGTDNERLISKVREASPDIIAITGDLVSFVRAKTIDRQIEIADTLIKGLTPIAPVYFITGNHEWDRRIGGPWALLEMLESRGVHTLRNEYIRLESGGDSMILAGTDDLNGPADMVKPREFIKSVIAAEGENFIVLLEHRNSRLSLYSDLGVDLILCGHAHGGMVRLPFTDGLIGPTRELFPTFTSGVYTKGSTNMLVSRGAGNQNAWPRFLNNPEIVAVTLRVEN